MPTRSSSLRRAALSAVLALVAVAAAAPGSAAAGVFTYQACNIDQGLTSPAFGGFSNRGMRSRGACNLAGAGQRGLITGNVVRSGRVKKGAQARYVLNAPPGTRFLYLDWSGQATRRDCRYSLQYYALRPDGPPKAIRNWRANRNCSKRERTQVATVGVPRPKRFNIAGATQLVQRAVCIGGRRKRFCSARARNSVTTWIARAAVLDLSAPRAGVYLDNPFTRGAWVRGDQSVTYNATDNLGVKRATVLGRPASHNRPCDSTRPVPCPNGPGRIAVDTTNLPEGTQQLRVLAIDGADNPGLSGPVTVRVDNTAPAGVPVAVEGGAGWRSTNSYALSWVNPGEGDRAPITGAHWSICRPDGTGCVRGSQAGAGIARLAGLRAPAEGVWVARVMRSDAAGNRNDAYGSPAVQLRLDQSAPTLAFQAATAADPTQVAVAVSDRISGVAGGQIELSAEGSNVWRALPTRLENDRLVARIDDAALPAGRYLLRSQARDLAGNVGVAAAPAAITLPLRIESTMRAAAEVRKIVRKRVGRGKNRRTVRRRETVLRPAARVAYGDSVTIVGRVANRDGQGLPGLTVQVLSATGQLLANLITDAQGGYSYRAAGSASRILRFVFAGSPLVLPSAGQVSLTVPAAGSFKPSRSKLPNGGRLVFRGRVRSLPLPAPGKLVELQVRQPSGEWTTFRTVRTDAQGRWRLPYRFRRVSCHTRFRLRANIPAEAGYPFAPGHSRARSVLVRGAEGPCP